MCGIIGIFAQDNISINYTLVNSLQSLQHRGQEAAGFATMEANRFFIKKGLGLVKEVVSGYNIDKLAGNAGIGHVRYPTAGAHNDPEQAQPFYVNSPFGIILAHNGNLINTKELLEDMAKKNHRHIRTQSDSEILTNVFAHELELLTNSRNLTDELIFEAIENVHKRVRGGYAVVSLIAEYGLVAFRDPYGIRPLIFGQKQLDGKTVYMFASESCALEVNGFDVIADVAPKEAIVINNKRQTPISSYTISGFKSKLSSKDYSTTPSNCNLSEQPSLNICLFEYVYIARPDSIIEGVNIQEARRKMGYYLAQKIKKEHQHLLANLDVVIPVPDTARSIAIEVASVLNKPYREGFVKNPFSRRTFMLATKEQRQIAVRSKLNPINNEFRGKTVLLVDDSIVRGTTSQEIINIVRKAGAKAVYIASAAPQVKHPNIYGIDMPTYNELIAPNKTDAEIAQAIGANEVIFQHLADLKKAISDLNPQITNFDSSCFDGNYLV